MKKRLFSWILAVVMILTTVTVIPFTASAAGAEYADDAAAVAEGYIFRTGAEGTATYYNDFYTATDEVADGGTVYFLADNDFNSAAKSVGISGHGDSGTALWARKTFTIEGNNHTISVAGNRPINFTNSVVTIQNLTITGATTFGQVRKASVVTLKDVTYTSSNNAWGAFAVYGKLILEGNTTITATGTATGNTNAQNSCVFLQSQAAGGDDATYSINTPTLVLRDNATLSAKNSAIDIGSVGNGCYIQVESGDVSITGAYTDATTNTYPTFGGVAYADMEEAEVLTYKTVLRWFGLLTSFVNDAEAVENGYLFKVEDKYYNSIFTAAVEVAEGGTIYVIGDYTHTANSNNNTTMIGAGGRNTGAAPKTYTIDGKISESKNATITVNPGNSYGLDFFGSNVTLKNLEIVGTRDSALTIMRVSGGSTVTLKDTNVTVKNAQYGLIAIYNGNLVLDGANLTIQGGAKYFFHFQNRNGDPYWSGTSPASAVQTTATVTIAGATAISGYAASTLYGNNGAATLAVNSPDVTLTNVSAGSFSSVSVRALTAEEQADPDARAAWKAVYTKFGAAWNYDPVAKVGETEYLSLADAVAAVPEGGTLTLLDDLSSGLVANNGKTFTIDGAGHSITCSSGPSLTVDAGTTVTVTNITLNSTGYRNTVAMNGGTLNVGDKATVINTDYTGGNSNGNAIRGTAADSGVVNVYDGATITAGTGAFVFDTNYPGSINIYGGTITSSFYVILFSGAAVKVNISGGTITNDNKNNAVQGIFRCYNAGAGHSVNITGGELHFSGNSLVTNGNDGAAMATPAFVTIGGTAVITNDKTEATLNVAAALATLSENAADVVAAGTALRLPTEARDGNSGVAFGSQIDRDAYNALVAGGYTVKTGTVILPTDLIPEETDLTLEALTAAKANFLKIENSGWYNAEEEEDFYLWYGSIVNLKETNFDREFTGFGYVELVYAVDTIGSIAFSFSGDAQTAVASELAAATLRGELNDAQTFMLDLYSGLVD